MKLPQVSINSLMVGVVIVALNLAAARGIFALDYSPYPLLLLASAPTALTLQFALFQTLRMRHRARAFWIGFVLAGSIAFGSFVWAQAFPKMSFLTPTGQTINDEGSTMAAIWSGYEGLVEQGLTRLGCPPQFGPDDLVTKFVLIAVVWTAPQWLIGTAGGLVALLFARRSRSTGPDSAILDAPDQDPSPATLAEPGLSC